MNLIHLGYCANLAYVIFENEVSASFETNHAVLAWYFLAEHRFMKIYGNRVKRENKYGQ